MDKTYRADLLAEVKANQMEWEFRIRQCGRRLISAVSFRETARSTHEKTGTVLLSVIGYYYSVFHISIAALYLDYRTKPGELRQMKHKNLRRLLQERLVNHKLLPKRIMRSHRELLTLRESANYTFGGKLPEDNMRYWERVPRLYRDTKRSFEACIKLLLAHDEVVSEGLGRATALANWTGDGLDNDAYRNHLSRDDEKSVTDCLLKWRLIH